MMHAKSTTLLRLAVSLLLSASCTEAADPAALLGKTLTNLEEVGASVDFSNPLVDPYPKLWYDTKIDKSRNCYVVYPSPSERRSYQLKSFNDDELAAIAPGTAFLTHYGACGVCSTLDDLYVYITKPDLTNPVRKCVLRTFGVVGCLRGLGFSETCARIWAWNGANTRKMHFRGGCLGTCIAHIFTPNNVPEGTYNPCEPLSTLSTPNPILSGPEPPGTGASAVSAAGACEGDAAAAGGGKGNVVAMDGRKKQSNGHCGNTINGQPACITEQWQNGPLRMNPCLQCDECRSGPIFQKIAGRTRRASGIHSAIERPGVPDLEHDYA